MLTKSNYITLFLILSSCYSYCLDTAHSTIKAPHTNDMHIQPMPNMRFVELNIENMNKKQCVETLALIFDRVNTILKDDKPQDIAENQSSTPTFSSAYEHTKHVLNSALDALKDKYSSVISKNNKS